MPDFVRPLNLKKPVVNRKLIAWGFILTGLISVGSWAWGRAKHTQPATASIEETKGIKEEGGGWWGRVKISYTVQPQISPTPATQAIVAQLQTQLATASGEYGIYIYRLEDKVGYGVSSEKVFPAASIMKVPIMVATYRKVETGSLKLDEVQGLLEAMGKKSDNAAPIELIKLIGRKFVRETVRDLGMIHSDFDANTTTASDLGVMWKNLYEGKLISSQHWQQMQDFLTQSIFEDRIPAGVPPDTRVIHKVGTELDEWADAGIVMSKRPFIVVILNQKVNLTEAAELVPQLIKTIWNKETAGQ